MIIYCNEKDKGLCEIFAEKHGDAVEVVSQPLQNPLFMSGLEYASVPIKAGRPAWERVREILRTMSGEVLDGP